MYPKYSDGMIEVIVGPMFSGKTEELLKKLRILSYAKFNTLVIKPSFDTRFATDQIVSRNGLRTPTHSLKNIKDIHNLLKQEKYQAILIDEAHFFGDEIIEVCDDLANSGYLVIIAGLDLDYLRRPFNHMAQLMAIAEKVTKLYAICVQCQNIATTSFKKIKNNDLHFLGDTDEYEARCRKCHLKG
ncbi:Thymidine kinase [Metamycoplasma auris 15026]|uniref:Thymidine kinase n=1 Tax=Metamycoplasma auris 15026 TaxID=1188233 RepID=N9VB85_9BACT|nr:thymidine kinase [Metamycoplasma auris]ENY68651.1 Thymidine kinase [Metamycoplasma auris 15026]